MARRDVESAELEDGDTSTEESLSCGSEAAWDAILEAFLEMQPRKVRRVRYSRLARRPLSHHVTSALEALIVFLLIANLFHLSVSSLGLQRYYPIPVVVTLAILASTVVHTVTTPEHTFTAWVSTEVHIFCLWTAWMFKDFRNKDPKEACVRVNPSLCIQHELVELAKGFLVAFGLTCLLYVVKFLALECVTRSRRCRMLAVIHWHLARPVQTRPGLTTFSYRPAGWLSWSRAEFTYRGAVDEQGRPHGFGVWRDTSFHGEYLRGEWVHGRPAGPFTSRESGTGAQFLQRAVGYATSRGDCQPRDISKSSILPHKLDHLRYGVAQVEVSFAGGFFPFLPSVEHHRAEPSLARLVEVLSRPDGEQRTGGRCTVKLEVVNEADLSALRSDNGVTGPLRNMALPVQFLEGNCVGYVTPTALSQAQFLTDQAKDEALVFIHGYNCEISTALERVAQTFALGNMSPHIIPFVFSYSGGHVMQYFSAKTHMREYGADFAAFLRDLANHFEEVHILTHSCGAEFLFANWPAIAGCFQPARRQTFGATSPWQGPLRWVPHGQQGARGDPRLHLATLTLMNPDVLVEEVVGLLPEMMQVAEHFTTYNDSNDGALFWSGWLQKLVPRWYQERPSSEAETAVFGKMLKSLWVERGESGIHLQGDLLSRRRGFSRSMSSMTGAELADNPWPSGPHVPGDGSIDIINCSTIDQNVHNLRHNYYMLNTQMVEDVCELIGGRLTAPYRQRLCQVHANIFNFLSPPSYLKE